MNLADYSPLLTTSPYMTLVYIALAFLALGVIVGIVRRIVEGEPFALFAPVLIGICAATFCTMAALSVRAHHDGSRIAQYDGAVSMAMERHFGVHFPVHNIREVNARGDVTHPQGLWTGNEIIFFTRINNHVELFRLEEGLRFVPIARHG